MTCRELVDFLAGYLEGELSENVRLRFDEHLTACAECGAYLKMYRETVKVARWALEDPDGPVPADVPDDLVKAILAARQRR
jgi:anti-sigma factor RsiW